MTFWNFWARIWISQGDNRGGGFELKICLFLRYLSPFPRYRVFSIFSIYFLRNSIFVKNWSIKTGLSPYGEFSVSSIPNMKSFLRYEPLQRLKKVIFHLKLSWWGGGWLFGNSNARFGFPMVENPLCRVHIQNSSKNTRNVDNFKNTFFLQKYKLATHITQKSSIKL